MFAIMIKSTVVRFISSNKFEQNKKEEEDTIQNHIIAEEELSSIIG